MPLTAGQQKLFGYGKATASFADAQPRPLTAAQRDLYASRQPQPRSRQPQAPQAQQRSRQRHGLISTPQTPRTNGAAAPSALQADAAQSPSRYDRKGRYAGGFDMARPRTSADYIVKERYTGV